MFSFGFRWTELWKMSYVDCFVLYGALYIWYVFLSNFTCLSLYMSYFRYSLNQNKNFECVYFEVFPNPEKIKILIKFGLEKLEFGFQNRWYLELSWA